MNVVSTRPTLRTLEEGIHEVERSKGKVCVAQLRQPRAVIVARLERLDRHLNIDCRFGSKARNGCRPHMLNSKRKVAKYFCYASRFCRKLVGPSGIVWSNGDHRLRALLLLQLPRQTNVQCHLGPVLRNASPSTIRPTTSMNSRKFIESALSWSTDTSRSLTPIWNQRYATQLHVFVGRLR